MAKARSSSHRPIGPFDRAALTSRFIGLAGLSCGGIIVLAAHRADPARQPGEIALHYFVASLFLVPGILYMALASWVARGRKWAILASYALAWMNLPFLLLLFILLWGGTGAWRVLVPIALFVVALGTLARYLVRSLEALKRMADNLQ
jgi:hypothetical protein